MSKSLIKYSIIVPVYNGEDYLADCINSLCDIDYETNKYEIIIINDGSTDSTVDIIKNFIEKFPNIRYASQPNQGQGIARNLGLLMAKGCWILFVDSDDWINSGNVLKTFDALISSHDSLNIDMIKSTSLISENQRKINYFNNKCEKMELISGIDLLGKFSFAAHTFLGCYKKSFLNKVNYSFRKIHGFEDTDWTFMVDLKASNIILIDFPFYSYYYNPKGTSGNPNIQSFLGYIDSLNVMMHIIESAIMPESIKKRTCNWIKECILNPTKGMLKYSRNFKIKDSIGILKKINLSLIDSEIRPFCNTKDLFFLYLFRHNPYLLVVPIKILTLAKRRVRSLKKLR